MSIVTTSYVIWGTLTFKGRFHTSMEMGKWIRARDLDSNSVLVSQRQGEQYRL